MKTTIQTITGILGLFIIAASCAAIAYGGVELYRAISVITKALN